MPGPASGSRCTACNHPGASMLDKAIREGQSDYKVAAAFGLPRNTIQRHRKLHVKGLDIPGAVDREAQDFQPAEGGPREKLLAVIEQLEREAAGGHLRVEVARELRIAYADLEKMGGGEPPAEVAWSEVRGMPEFVALLTRVLDRHPAARKELAEGMAKAGIAEAMA